MSDLKVSSRFYARIDPKGRVALPDEFLDRVEDLKNPVGSKVYIYVVSKEG